MTHTPENDEASLPVDGEASIELRRLRRRLRKVEAELKARNDEVATLRSSHSFRLTAPLRWLRAQLAGGRSDAQAAKGPASGSVAVGEALVGLPSHLLADPESSADPNESHRPLRLDDALRPLLPIGIARGHLADGIPDGRTRYYGARALPLRVASITSRELREELTFDAAVTPLLACGWEGQLAGGTHDLILIEGAWEPEGGWGAAFAGTGESQARLEALLARCRKLQLPVVLWAREDVAGLDRLAWLVPRVDRVYAIDAAGQQWMEQHFSDVGCRLLPPAVQPALHNPVRSYALRDCQQVLGDKVLFDGWWDLAGGLGGNEVTIALGERLRVIESRWDYSRVRLDDSESYAPLALGSVTEAEKSALLRVMVAELFLPGSLTKSWRQANAMVRAAACGAAVFWGGKEAPSWSGTALRLMEARSAAAALAALSVDPLTTARAAHLAFREAVSAHCVADRLGQITRDLGLDVRVVDAPVRVAHLLVTMRPALLAACLRRFRADRYPQRELIVVLHGDDLDVAAARALVSPGEPIRILQAGRERSLGDCLNMAIAHADAPYWMKLDDDDLYGPAYTTDMMLYRRAIDAPVMGKPPMFLYLEQNDELRWDPVWASHGNLLHDADAADAALVAGGTLVGKREVLDSVKFSPTRRGGSDSEFIRRCYEHGHDVLAVDGFNFARFRSANAGFHTWKVADGELRERTVIVGDGAAVARHVFL